MSGDQFLGRKPPDSYRVVGGARTFGQLRPGDKGEVERDPSADAYGGATARVKARLEADDGNMARLFGIVPAPTVEDAKEHDAIDSAIGSVVEQATHGRQSRTERDRGYLKAARESRVEAEAAAKTARQEARWAKQEERDAKLRTWFEGKTDEEVSAYLASESFDRLSDRQQAVIHGVLDEIREGNAAEVDLAIEELEEEEFVFPESTEPMPWENRVDEEDDYSDTDEDDDDPGLTDDNYTET